MLRAGMPERPVRGITDNVWARSTPDPGNAVVDELFLGVNRSAREV
jgi:hypothetical protein